MLTNSMFFNFKKKPKAEVPLQPAMYTSCAELTLERFERCLVANDLNALLRDGCTATNEELKAAWEKIWMEYIDLSGDADFLNYRGKKADEMRGAIKIQAVEDAVRILWNFYYQPLIDVLKQWGFDETDGYTYDYTNISSYRRDLDRAYSSLQLDEERIKQLHREMDNYTTRHKGGSVTTKYFDRLLLEIEEMQGIKMNKSITVKEFTVYLDKLRDRYKAMEAKNRKK